MNDTDDRQGPGSPIADGPAAQRAAAIDLSASLNALYDQAIRLGHVEAALFIGCATLSISETLALEGVRAGSPLLRSDLSSTMD